MVKLKQVRHFRQRHKWHRRGKRGQAKYSGTGTPIPSSSLCIFLTRPGRVSKTPKEREPAAHTQTHVDKEKRQTDRIENSGWAPFHPPSNPYISPFFSFFSWTKEKGSHTQHKTHKHLYVLETHEHACKTKSTPLLTQLSQTQHTYPFLC